MAKVAKKPVAKKATKKVAAKTTKTTKVATKKTTAKPRTKKVASTSKQVKNVKLSPVKAEANVAAPKQIVKRAPLTPLERLRSVHISTAISSILFAILTLVFVGPASAELLNSHQARDAFANLDTVVLGSASEAVINVQYRYILIAALVTSAIGSLLLATKLRARYEATVKSGISGLRWIFMGISAAIMLQLVSFIGGVQDGATLKTSAALIVATVLFGWIADRDNAGATSPKWLAFVASLYTGALAWFPLLGSLSGTTVYGGERFGWHVYALAAVTLAGFTGFALNQYASIRKKSQLDTIVYEQRYLRIDQFTKFAVVLIIFIAFAK